ncbi:MAG TPA: hypothetical protein VGG21_06920 [Acidimicrobiales bacterium]
MKVATAGACALVLALVLVLTLPQSSSSAGAAAAVRSALDNTLTSPAMSFTSTEQIGISSATISTSGSGTCDLQSGSCEVTMNYSGAESSFGPETGRYIGNVLYYEMGPAIRSELPTPWISLDLGNLRSLEGGSPESPLAGLSYLAQTGSVVTDNGTTTMNGAPVTQYSVTYSASSIQKIVTEVGSKLPSWFAGIISKISDRSVSETVDVDAQGRLAYINLQETETVAGKAASIQMSETVTSFGAAVSISAPPASEVTPLQTLLKGDPSAI